MTRNMAEELFEEIIVTLDNETKRNGFPDDIQDAILEKCIDITVDEFGEKSIMILNEKPKTIKLANISIDLKQAIEISLEVLLTTAIPTDKLGAVKMILLVVLKAWQLSTKSISDQMADVVLMLNELNAYQHAISVEYLNNYINKQSLLFASESSRDLDGILDDLYNYKIIDITDGKVMLHEKILYAK